MSPNVSKPERSAEVHGTAIYFPGKIVCFQQCKQLIIIVFNLIIVSRFQHIFLVRDGSEKQFSKQYIVVVIPSTTKFIFEYGTQTESHG